MKARGHVPKAITVQMLLNNQATNAAQMTRQRKDGSSESSVFDGDFR